MGKTNVNAAKRNRRKKSIRKKLFGTPERPRLTVFRSSKHIYAQIIDDVAGATLATASTMEPAFREKGDFGGNTDAAKLVGGIIGSRAKEAGVESVIFDRNGYLYHGRVKALADGAREAGLRF
jgi:large subunit ribosomal protein L18